MRLGHRKGGKGFEAPLGPQVKVICFFCSVEIKDWTFESSSAPLHRGQSTATADFNCGPLQLFFQRAGSP